MSENSDSEINALDLSQLGQSIDACIKAERADLDQALARYDAHMEQVNQQLAALAQFMTEPQSPPEEWLKPLSDLGESLTDLQRNSLNALHHAITDTLAQSAQTTSELQALGETFKAQVAAEAEWKIERLNLVHKAQIETVQARDRTIAEELARRLEELQAQAETLLGEQRLLIEDNVRLAAELEIAKQDGPRLADLQTQLRELNRELSQHHQQQRELNATLATQHQKLLLLTGHNERLQERLTSSEEVIKQNEALCDSLGERLNALKRNARARDTMFREESAQIRMAEKEVAVREAARAARAEQRLAALTIRFGTWSGEVLSVATEERIPVERGIEWLVLHAPSAMLDTRIADPTFEHSCAFALGDQDFIAASYQWLLGRPRDDEGMGHYLRQLGSGATRRDMLVDLARSQEAAARPRRVVAQLPYEVEEFVESAYRAVLERPADVQGMAHYSNRLRSSGNREAVLLDLARSVEALARPLALAGALRCIDALRRRRRAGTLRRKASQIAGLHHPELNRAWQAGRLAAIAGDAERAWDKIEVRISDLQANANARIAAAEDRIRFEAAERTTPAPNAVGQPPLLQSIAEPPLRSLEDASADRTPSAILSAIRAELTTARRG